MADKDNLTTEGMQPVELQDKANDFAKKNGKYIIGALVVVLGAVAFFMYNKSSKEKKSIAALDEVYHAQEYFEMDSFQLALFGDGVYMGFDDIINEYGGSSVANGATFSAGVCAMQLGDLEGALDYFSAFKAGDAELHGAKAQELMGDCHADLGNTDKAMNAYKKATSVLDNKELTPRLLMKAGDYYRFNGKNAEAAKMYNRIKTEYPTSREANDIDKWIALVKS